MWEQDTTAAIPASGGTAAVVTRCGQREGSIPITLSR
jgi:hypothetical protein